MSATQTRKGSAARPAPARLSLRPTTPAPLTREGWLLSCAAGLYPLLADAQGKLADAHPDMRFAAPDTVPLAVSVGFPKGARGRGKAIGQCWPVKLARDARSHIFISPEIHEPLQVAATLLHEMIHAVLPPTTGHKRYVSALARGVGLVKPWTATTSGEECSTRLNVIVEGIGQPYPHGALIPTRKLKPGSRLRLWTCACETKVRLARDEWDATCNECGERFVRGEK